MKTIVNKKFVKALQSELDRKASDFDGKHNPKFYKNMRICDLWRLISHDVLEIEIIFGKQNKAPTDIEIKNVRKRLLAISNRCSMIWEKLNHKDKDR